MLASDMTRILLIRHGKAADNWAHYDELSPVGHAQSAQLGERLFKDAEEPAAIFHGTLHRQRVTAEVVHAKMAERGARLPSLSVLPGLNEMSQAVVNVARAKVPAGPRRDLIEAWATGTSRSSKDVRRFMLESYFAYGKGDIVGDFESYLAFRDRVITTLREMLQPERSTVLAFTSGGVIAAAAGYAMEAPLDRGIRLMATIENTSITEIRHSRRTDRFSLVRLNDVSHVPVAERTLL
jgi:broad specificity phosphatase PhoE